VFSAHSFAWSETTGEAQIPLRRLSFGEVGVMEFGLKGTSGGFVADVTGKSA